MPICPPTPFLGVPVRPSPHAVAVRWVPPKERFFEWGDSPGTERTLRYFGIGREEVVPAAYMVGGELLIHPALLAAIPRLEASLSIFPGPTGPPPPPAGLCGVVPCGTTGTARGGR